MRALTIGRRVCTATQILIYYGRASASLSRRGVMLLKCVSISEAAERARAAGRPPRHLSFILHYLFCTFFAKSLSGR